MSKLLSQDSGRALLGFVDIVGSRERLLAITNAQEALPYAEKMRKFQQAFFHEPLNELDIGWKGDVSCLTNAFSDSLIFSIPTEKMAASPMGEFDSIAAVLYQIGLNAGGLMLEGLFFRGGIDLGFSYHEKDILVSPALLTAFDIEQRIGVPVIGLSTGLVEFLSSHTERRYYSPESDPLKYLVRRSEFRNFSFHHFDAMRCVLESIDWEQPGISKKIKAALGPDEKESIRSKAFWENRDMCIAIFRGRIQEYRTAKGVHRANSNWVTAYYNELVSEYASGASRVCLLLD